MWDGFRRVCYLIHRDEADRIILRHPQIEHNDLCGGQCYCQGDDHIHEGSIKLVVAVYARHQEFHCTLEELWDGSIDYTFMLVVKSSIAHLKNYGFILTAGVGVDGVFCTVRRQENMGGIEANCERNCGITSKPSVGRENSMIAASDVR